MFDIKTFTLTVSYDGSFTIDTNNGTLVYETDSPVAEDIVSELQDMGVL